MKDTIVSRDNWVDGLVQCPNCGLHLERVRDHGEYLWDYSDARSYGVEGTHKRCGAAFRFNFDDATVLPRHHRDRR